MINKWLLGGSLGLSLLGAIAVSHQPEPVLKSSPYTSIQEVTYPPKNPIITGAGFLSITLSLFGSVFSYSPKPKQEIEEETIPPVIYKVPKAPVSEAEATEFNFPDDDEVSEFSLEKVRGVSLEKIDSDFDKVIKSLSKGSALFAGARGSGKSSALRYFLAKRLEARPDTQILIIDPHFDVEEDVWIPGFSEEDYKDILIRKPEQALEAVRSVFNEGLRREEYNLRKEAPILVVIDEYQGFTTRSDSVKEMSDIITYIQNGFRKFGVDIWVGLHSLKNKNCGLDSSATMQMNWYLLGNLINDTNTIIPDNWNRTLLHRQRINLGKYAAIVCEAGDDPFVTSTPNIPELFKSMGNKEEKEEDEPTNVIDFNSYKKAGKGA